jgi:hypothetical protein
VRVFGVTAVFILCVLATAVGASASSAVACHGVPSAYRSSQAKGGFWVSTCLVCKAVGPRKLARSAHLASADPRTVARKYAESYVRLAQAQPIVRRLGGKSSAKTIIESGCYAGFKARGRP